MGRGSIFQQLKNQPRSVLDKLYDGKISTDTNGKSVSSQWACKAIFQSLSALSKCIVMRLLFFENSFVFEEFLASCVTSGSEKLCQEAWDEIVSLRIVVRDEASNTSDSFKINPCFQRSMKTTLLAPTEPWSGFVPSSGQQVHLTTISTLDLDRYSMDKWNEVLGYLVNLLPSTSLPSNILIVFVKRSGLMAEAVDPVTGKRINKITARGYEYMLKDYLSQVWDFVMVAVKHSPNQEDALSLLFTLSYCTFGKGYPIDALSKAQQQLVFEFSQVGIIFMPSITSPYFYPSRVAINMIFGATEALQGAVPSTSRSFNTSAEGSQHQQQQSLQVIVETNNQVTAYLTNDIHLAMLQLFVDVTVRMPNMALGRITKEKVRQAFKMGIKASQIVDFLVLHAHPHVRKNVPIIPENVTDELALWEAEGHRIQSQSAVVVDFREFSNISSHEFTELVTSLRQQTNYVLWDNKDKLMLAVNPEGLQQVRSFVQRCRLY